MGCFDFIYADNGQNIMGKKGYLYLTDNFCYDTGLKSPVRFLDTDAYGNLRILMSRHKIPLEVDIYACYAAMLYLDNLCTDTANHDIRTFLGLLRYYRVHQTMPKESDYDTFIKAMDNIRDIGIHIFFNSRKNLESPMTITIPALGNQKEKTITGIQQVFTGKLPLVVTRKKLPVKDAHESFITTVQNWGLVTFDDPNQGFSRTVNHFMPWVPN